MRNRRTLVFIVVGALAAALVVLAISWPPRLQQQQQQQQERASEVHAHVPAAKATVPPHPNHQPKHRIILGVSVFPGDLLRTAALVQAQLPLHLRWWTTWQGAMDPRDEYDTFNTHIRHAAADLPNERRKRLVSYNSFKAAHRALLANPTFQGLKHTRWEPRCLYWPLDRPRSAEEIAADLLQRLRSCMAGLDSHRHPCVVSDWADDLAVNTTAHNVRNLLVRELVSGHELFDVRVVYVQPVEPLRAVDATLTMLKRCHRSNATLVDGPSLLVLPAKIKGESTKKWFHRAALPVYQHLLGHAHRVQGQMLGNTHGQSDDVHSDVVFDLTQIHNETYLIDFLCSSANVQCDIEPGPVHMAINSTYHWANLASIWHTPHGSPSEFRYLLEGRLSHADIMKNLTKYHADASLRRTTSIDNITFVTISSYSKGAQTSVERAWTLFNLTNTRVLRPSTLNDTERWSWIVKPRLLYNLLTSPHDAPTTPFIVVTDGFDVFLSGPVDRIVEGFESYRDADVLLSSSKNDWPSFSDAHTFEKAHAWPSRNHVHGSAGTSAITAFVKEILEGFETKAGWTSTNPLVYNFDDQVAWRRLMIKHYPRIQVDSRVLVFSRADECLDEW